MDYNKIKIIFFFILFIFLGCKNNKDTWELILPAIPLNFSTRDARINYVYYLLKQTHEPLFRKDDGENFTSEVLKKWNRSIDYREYYFCPNTDLFFNEKVRFDKSFFQSYITETTKKFDNNFKLSEKGDCFKISFFKSQKKFLDFLTLYENAPTITRNKDIEDGLGEFYIKEIKKDEILLERKKHIRNGYNKIRAYEYKRDDDYNLYNQNIKDWNYIPTINLPKWIINKYKSFNIIELKSVILIINHPDKKIREFIYNCTDINTLRLYFYPTQNSFINIKTILPLGVSGAEPGLPEQNCKIKNIKKLTLRFGNWRTDNIPQMQKFSEDFYKRYKVRIKINNYSIQEFAKILSNSNKKYNLTIIALDAVRNDESAFFEPFVSNFYHDNIPKNLITIYNKLPYEVEKNNKKLLINKMLQIIKEEYLALPLYQSIKKVYYPPEIKNITVGCGFLQYPEVAEFRW